MEKALDGDIISQGEFELCDEQTMKEYIKFPELSVVDIDDIFCPPIDISKKIQSG